MPIVGRRRSDESLSHTLGERRNEVWSYQHLAENEHHITERSPRGDGKMIRGHELGAARDTPEGIGWERQREKPMRRC